MTKKMFAKKIKSFLKPSARSAPTPTENSPDFLAALAKLMERMEALERKTDLIFAQVSKLPSEIRNAIQQLQRPNQSHPTQGAQRLPASALAQPPQQLPMASHSVQLPQHPARGSVPSRKEGRRERLLHKAICADCSLDCEVPIKPTEGRPVYCKACFVLRKSAKALPTKSAERINAVGTMQKMARPVPNLLPAPPQGSAVSSGNVADASALVKSGHVPPQIHNLARRSAVAYMAKRAGHLPSSPNVRPQTPAGPVHRAAGTKNVRPKSIRNDRAKPQKKKR